MKKIFFFFLVFACKWDTDDRYLAIHLDTFTSKYNQGPAVRKPISIFSDNFLYSF